MNVKAFLLILLTIAIDIGAMYFGYLTLWVLGIFLTLMLVLSAIMAICGIWQLQFRQALIGAVVEKGTEARLTVQCYNRGIFLYPQVRILYRSGDGKVVSVCPGTQTVDIGYIFQRKGKYPVGVDKIVAYDAFGVFCRRVRFPEPELVYVLPKAGVFQGQFLEEAGKSSEEGVKRKKLEDRTTVSDLREYQYGDTLNSINWKATAKRNEVIVNHYENEFCTRVFIYVDSAVNLELDDYACDLALTHTKAILNHDGMVTLLYSGKESVLDSKLVKSFEEYGIYLADTTGTGLEEQSFWDQDRIQMEKLFFQKDTYNQAVFYLQRPVTPAIEQLIRQLENLHIKVEVHQLGISDSSPYSQASRSWQREAGHA